MTETPDKYKIEKFFLWPKFLSIYRRKQNKSDYEPVTSSGFQKSEAVQFNHITSIRLGPQSVRENLDLGREYKRTQWGLHSRPRSEVIRTK